jgi:hypothetical protein
MRKRLSGGICAFRASTLRLTRIREKLSSRLRGPVPALRKECWERGELPMGHCGSSIPGCNGLRSKPAPRERWLEGLTWFQPTSCYYFHPIGLKGPVAFLLLDCENLETDELRV